jgi:hypothetical protein
MGEDKTFTVEHETFSKLEIELAKLNAPDKNECVIWAGAKVTNTVRNYSFAVDITNLNSLNPRTRMFIRRRRYDIRLATPWARPGKALDRQCGV